MTAPQSRCFIELFWTGHNPQSKASASMHASNFPNLLHADSIASLSSSSSPFPTPAIPLKGGDYDSTCFDFARLVSGAGLLSKLGKDLENWNLCELISIASIFFVRQVSLFSYITSKTLRLILPASINSWGPLHCCTEKRIEKKKRRTHLKHQ